MNISGIRPGVGFYNYNIDSTKGAEEINAPVNSSVEAKAEPFISQEEIDAARAGQTYGSADFAKEYKANESYEMKGATSDLRTLDVEKAINDMQKDQMLSQYQYFVGEANSMQNTQSAAVRGVENFDL
ncbi:MAG: hypothetical protein MJ110_06880 [Lachnospiraceae bacterium]|nr:hypothetical protein [Lachnospiraceae bacterium]